MKLIKHHWELDVYKLSVEAAMDIFRASKRWPKEEMFSLTDQIRRSSRSVSGQIAEGWRRRKYENPNCGNGAKQQNQLSLISHCDSDRSY